MSSLEPPRIVLESVAPLFLTHLSVFPIKMYAIHPGDTDTDRAALLATYIAAYPPATASYLEFKISIALAIKLLCNCTLENYSGMMSCECQTWTLRWVETFSSDNCHHILLQLQTGWAYWVLGAFFHCLFL